MILEALIFALGFNILMFIPAFIWKTDKLTDISYSITFIGLALYIFFSKNYSLKNLILLIMVLIWATRLGTFLFIRIRKQKKDDRFDDMRNNFFKFLGFWLLQGFTAWIILTPMILATQKYCFLGLIIWLTGILIESFADYQKFSFKKTPKNKNKFIQTGLWKYSRHPNYFGEILCWVGVYIFAGAWTWGLISPIYIIFLLTLVSGIPLLEKKANKKWAKNKNYQKYKKETSILVPWIKTHK